MRVPDSNFLIETDRLILEPIQSHHAESLVNVLADPTIYAFIPHHPPSLETLRLQYAKWEKRISPEQDEIWLNWAVYAKPENTYIGYFQASYKDDKKASLGYVIGSAYHGKGYALEGLQSVISMLFADLNMTAVKAWIDTRNAKSIRLVEKLGMTQIETIEKADHFKGEDSDEFVFELRRQTIV